MALRVGLVGCGRWGRFILRDLKVLGAHVTVVVIDDASRANAVQMGADAIVTDLAGLPNDLEGIVVATTIATHAAVVEALLPRGAALFVEKPLTDDVASARRIAAAAPDRVFVMEKWRYHPGVESLRDIARSGELGPVEWLRTRRLGWGLKHAGDAVWTLAPHDMSIVHEILGALPEPLTATAEIHAGEPVGLICALGSAAPRVFVDVSARYPGESRSIVLACRDGVATLADSYADAIEIWRSWEATVERRPIPQSLPLLDELRAFLGFLRGGPPPKAGVADALATVEMLARLRQLAGI